ncbi:MULTISPECIES: flagellar basal body rod protein FlgC [Thermomicrobium]|jgi:flagellar basal-body rod protein FlgC|uniref:Flagellar basal-body rod protein FlgC n=1 Tax=Thermomicrobium roseum (strain ATCC 27502 / DSM 5159 / P-2) TaxID=309801 RepID=B9L4D9_THERP|nr:MULTISPECIES: flagellar basal body rod protein FlgC [Thermomicrobium]ACM07178.1 flagellar basal-body rod protein FlgC [Thermomicrobium roseum DSM 5159]MBO9307210.1 flagellar basal body rod protein FlgC [Thermomicrobium sp.]MBO9350746.1 flagellar basal body rod protein FlgC [Thermomicrobium sp.]MBO9358680.1 flagellar basal body rod protein FlgC [Thermomicrobium sp.]MBO9386273.1 flagellar basal body rod protein FlgC [Thermomicrobium sp.]
MGILETMRVSLSALTAQRVRMDVTASNLANVDTTRTPQGGPYLRRQVVFATEQPSPFARLVQTRTGLVETTPSAGRGVQVAGIVVDRRAVREVYDPTHPDADANGIVRYPDIDVVSEMTNLMAATRAYEANVTVLDALKTMAMRALSIGRA